MLIVASVLLGTTEGLHAVSTGRHELLLGGRSVTALAGAPGDWSVLLDGRSLVHGDGGSWREVATVDGPAAACVGATAAGVLVGTARGHLLRLDGTELRQLDSFETAEGRGEWYTPWGDPADVRSLCETAEGIFVNVHVGGILRSSDGTASWHPTIDIHADVHQVGPGHTGAQVLAATAQGLAVSEDGGTTWRYHTAGLPATYLRAVAVCGDSILVSASSGPGGRRSGVHRTSLDAERAFEQCDGGLPADFGKNIDTHCLAGAGHRAVIGTADGTVYWSADGGASWDVLAKGLGSISCVVLGEDD